MSVSTENHVEVAEGSVPQELEKPDLGDFEGIYKPKPSIPGCLFYSDLMPFEKDVKSTIVHFHRLPGLQPYCWIPGSPDIKTLLDGKSTPDKYMKQPKPDLKGSGSADAELQWIHLPANNMSWVERLMVVLYGNPDTSGSDPSLHQVEPSSSTKGKEKVITNELPAGRPAAGWILRDQHWRGCQSKSTSQTAHGLFMQPMHSKISPYPSDDGIFSVASEDNSFVTFMPFLHWATKDDYIRRNKCLDWMCKSTQKCGDEGTQNVPNLRADGKKVQRKNAAADATMTLRTRKDIPWETVEDFLLYDKLHLAYVNEASPLHVRQTLDQSFYYNLDEMDIRGRDLDQVVYRYFERHSLDQSLRLIMVDQLWLWELHPPRQPHTIVTAFPTRTGFSELSSKVESDRSDVLWRIQQALDKPSPAISSANDLICLIIDKASSLFHPQSDETDHLLPEYHEAFASTIADLSVRSTKLSDDMAHSAKRLVKLQDRKRDVLNVSLREGWFMTQDAYTRKPYDTTTGSVAIPPQPYMRVSATASNPWSENNDIKAWFETPTTPADDPLSSVKDELTQHSVLKIESAIDKEMDALINVSEEMSLLREVKDVLDELNSIGHIYVEQIKVVKRMVETDSSNEFHPGGDTQVLLEVKDGRILVTSSEGADASVKRNLVIRTQLHQDGTVDGSMLTEGQSSNAEWRLNEGKQHVGDRDTDRATRQRCKQQYHGLHQLLESRKRDIDSLSDEARRVYKSLCDLLDLKQKQAGVVEAYAARQEAKETAQQGRILLVFTIVTIVFLPLSFIASIFSMNAREINGWDRPAWQIMAIMWPTATFIFVISLTLAYINTVQWFFSGLKSFFGAKIAESSISAFIAQRNAPTPRLDRADIRGSEGKQKQGPKYDAREKDNQVDHQEQTSEKARKASNVQVPATDNYAREEVSKQGEKSEGAKEKVETEKNLIKARGLSKWRAKFHRLCSSSSTSIEDASSRA